ncbi:MAG: hypothetical protein AB8I08_08225 [Sandaracinaceae bacterium]
MIRRLSLLVPFVLAFVGSVSACTGAGETPADIAVAEHGGGLLVVPSVVVSEQVLRGARELGGTHLEWESELPPACHADAEWIVRMAVGEDADLFVMERNIVCGDAVDGEDPVELRVYESASGLADDLVWRGDYVFDTDAGVVVRQLMALPEQVEPTPALPAPSVQTNASAESAAGDCNAALHEAESSARGDADALCGEGFAAFSADHRPTSVTQFIDVACRVTVTRNFVCLEAPAVLP